LKSDVQSEETPYNDYKNIDLNILFPFKNHPYKLREGKELASLVEDIRKSGVQENIVVRKITDDKV
jgi:ParB family chromosome partitioning protein